MIELGIDLSWKYKELVSNIEAIKSEYKGICASFLYFELAEKVKFIKRTKEKVYLLPFELWKKDKIWEYLNDYEEIEVLEKFM